MIQQKNLNNLTKQNVFVQYPILQQYIFQTVYSVLTAFCITYCIIYSLSQAYGTAEKSEYILFNRLHFIADTTARQIVKQV